MPNTTIYDYMAIALQVVSALTLLFVLKRDLLMLQLNSYRNERYTRWFNESHESTTTQRMVSCVALFVVLVNSFPFVPAAAISIILQLWVIIRLATKRYKKSLVFTKRAKRIYATMIIVCGGVAVASALIFGGVKSSAVATISLSVISPIVLLISNWMLTPIERHINKKYYDEAADILRSMPDLKIIGITGSYGKTSTKHYLHRILSEKYDVLMTPGSFNTTLGVVRTIREHLKPYNEVFIVEMGAKQPGDIKEICDLVHPEIGIVTAVGEQHLESFKTIENIQRTKFELIDALPASGFAILNNDFENVSNRAVTNVKSARYGIRNTASADCIISKITVSATGTDFSIDYMGQEVRFHTRLVGECNISNLTAAIVAALHLGVEIEKIKYAVEKIEQVEHRLNMKKTPGGITIIDDAFNSNPTGSAMALDVLGSISGGKRIIVTPGMIELGDRQQELNFQFGKRFHGNCDLAIVIGEYNKQAIVEGALDGGMSADDIITAPSFEKAQEILNKTIKAGDIVLYENDLPDTFK